MWRDNEPNGLSSSEHQRPAIPDHELLRLIGRGSYGEVWLARTVMGSYRAVKVVYEKAFKERQTYEREFKGVRQFEPVSRSHEGFVDVLHIGQNTDDGYFYYVMELGDDQATDQEIDPQRYRPHTLSEDLASRQPLPFANCLAWGRTLCQALMWLHEHQLIHRDVKPSNIIFIQGVPKLADVGLVSAIAEANSYVGTEGFVSPQGPNSAPADLYSLGKVLYEMSSGQDRMAFPELPATWGASSEAAQMRELNEVIVKACHSDPAQRYPAARDMLADLNLLEAGKSVYRLHQLEHRLAWAKKLAFFLVPGLLIGGVLYWSFQNHRIESAEILQRQVGLHLSDGTRALEAGDLLGALPFFAEVLDLDRRRADREALYRLRLGAVMVQTPKLVQMWFHDKTVKDVEFGPDAKHLLTAQWNGKVQLWDVQTGLAAFPEFGTNYGQESATLSRDGKRALTAAEDGNVILYHVGTGEVLGLFPHDTNVFSARFSPDGQRLVTACKDKKARIWDVASQRIVLELTGHTDAVLYAAWSPDGRQVVTASRDKTAMIWDAQTGLLAGEPLPHQNWVYQAQFSPDGQRLVTASFDRRARLWQVASAREIPSMMQHDDGVMGAVFSPDGCTIATGSFDSTVRFWDGFSGRVSSLNPVLRHSAKVMRVVFSPDGHRIATACWDGTVRIWDLAGSQAKVRTLDGCLSGDRLRLAQVSGSQCRIQSLPPAAGGSLINCLDSIESAGLNDDGSLALIVSATSQTNLAPRKNLRIWSIKTGEAVSPPLPWSQPLTAVSLSVDGQWLAAISNNIVRRIKVATGEPWGTPLVHDGPVTSVVYSPDGRQLLTICGVCAWVWNAKSVSPTALKLTHRLEVSCARFSPDNQWIVTAFSSSDLSECAARVWNARTGEPSGHLMNHRDGVLDAIFSPDGRKVATASEDFTAMIWDAQTGEPLTSSLRHKGQVGTVCFSQDGRLVVTVCKDGTAFVWDAESSLPLTPPLVHLGSPIRAGFIPGSYDVMTSSGDSRNWLWALTVDNHSDEDWRLFARLLAATSLPGHRMSANEDLGAMKTLWLGLKTKYPDDFRVNEDQVANWHDREAWRAEQNRNWPAALFHLDRLIAIRPGETSLLKQRDRVRKSMVSAGSIESKPTGLRSVAQ